MPWRWTRGARNAETGTAPRTFAPLDLPDTAPRGCRDDDRGRGAFRASRQEPGRGNRDNILGTPFWRIRLLLRASASGEGRPVDPDSDRPLAWLQGRDLEHRCRGTVYRRRESQARGRSL